MYMIYLAGMIGLFYYSGGKKLTGWVEDMEFPSKGFKEIAYMEFTGVH